MNRIDALTKFSLNRRITVLVLFLSTLVVGVIATIGIPQELMPRGYDAKSLQVFVPWGNAPSQEVLDKVTLPLEEELSTVKGLEGMNTVSETGRSAVFLRFKYTTDMDIAYREVRDRVERAKPRFPDAIERVLIRKQDTSSIPVAFIGLAVDPNLTDYYNLIDKNIVLPLERIDGVAAVTANGLEEKEIIIEVDREKLEGAGLNIFDLAGDLGDDNFTMASGNVRDAGKKFLLRSVATYRDLNELENRLISYNTRLKDVAVIRYEEADRRYSVRVNSRPAVALIIQKEGEANTVEVCRRINETLDELAKDPRLAGVDIEPLFNQGDIIEDAIGNLVGSGRIGGIFAVIVLFFFLRRFRLTLIITLSIPISLLIALTVMYFMGESLNILTMLGLMVCIGLLVDNSVVVAENIHRLHRDGMSRLQACVKGAGEMALAITMATLTTVIVFLPVSLIEGQGQFFLMRLSMPISVSLLASLLVALIFIPLCVYLTLPKEREPKRTLFTAAHDKLNAVLRGIYEATFGRINHLYTRFLAFFLRHRFDLVLAMACIFMLSINLGSNNLSFVEQQEEDRTGFEIDVELSKQYDFEDAKAYFGEVEKLLESRQEEFGLDGYFIFHLTQFGEVQGWLSEETTRNSTANQIAQRVYDALPKRPGIELYLGTENDADTEDTEETFVVRLQGEDPVQLETIAEELEPIFAGVDGVLGLKKADDNAPNELAMVIDRDRANLAGVNPEWVAGVINYAILGSRLPRYNEDGREIPVRVRFEESDRETLDDLNTFAVPTMSGTTLPVSALTDMRMLNTAPRIFRADKKITRTITLELIEDQAKETRQRLTALSAGMDLPEGVSFAQPRTLSGNEDLQQLVMAFLLSILFIYLLMAFLFENFFLPLSIIFTIPLGIIGVIFVHIIAGKNFDFLGVVGCILLVGVVVNNGIVLIDYVNRLRQDGMERTKALLTAAERRFRPIAMTALTTIIGMIPLTISPPSELGLSYKSFGLTLIGGMTTATLLTLLVVPVLYTAFDDLWLYLQGIVRRITQGRAEPVKSAA